MGGGNRLVRMMVPIKEKCFPVLEFTAPSAYGARIGPKLAFSWDRSLPRSNRRRKDERSTVNCTELNLFARVTPRSPRGMRTFGPHHTRCPARHRGADRSRGTLAGWHASVEIQVRTISDWD